MLVAGAAGLAIVNIATLTIGGRPWGVTSAFALWGAKWFAALGIDVESARVLRRKFAASCLDWSERRDHLGGALGAALAERLVDLGWIARKRNSRAVSVTEAGRRKLAEEFPQAFMGQP